MLYFTDSNEKVAQLSPLTHLYTPYNGSFAIQIRAQRTAVHHNNKKEQKVTTNINDEKTPSITFRMPTSLIQYMRMILITVRTPIERASPIYRRESI